MESEWKLGVDLSVQDNLLDGFTFDDLILAVQCNCRKITPASVYAEVAEIMAQRKQDMVFLVNNNMNEIIAAAKSGRNDY